MTATRAAITEMLVMLIEAAIAQLGERQTEDLKVPGSIPGLGIFSGLCAGGLGGGRACRPP